MLCIMLSFVKKYNSLSVRPIVTLLTRVLFSIFILQPHNNTRWSLQFYQFLNIVEINLIFADTVCIYFLIISRQFVSFFLKTISVCHTFEIIERCILTADSQGLRLLTGGGPPPVARAFALLSCFLFLFRPLHILPFLFAFRHSSGYARRTNCIYTLKYMKN
jgi:hypothetical protein